MTGAKHLTVENLSACIAVIWGFALLNPYTDLFPRNPALFRPMASISSSEFFWGALFLTVGVAAIVIGYFIHRRWAAFTMAAWFISISILFFAGDNTSQAWAIYGLIAIFNFLHWRALGWTDSSG